MTAAARAAATRAHNPVIVDRLAEPLVEAVGLEFFIRWARRELPSDTDDAGLGWQPMTDALTVRTRYFDDFLVEAAAAGVRQVVILGSGLDTRGYRIAWPDSTVLFDVDQPKVVAFKSATMSCLRVEPTADIRHVGIDLRNDWPAALQRAGFVPDQPTAWIAEGLLAYLPPSAQDSLLDEITALSATGSRLATEVFKVRNLTEDGMTGSNLGSAVFLSMEAGSDHAQARLQSITDEWRSHGLDVDLGGLAYQDDRHDVATYLRARGWASANTSMADLFAVNGMSLRRNDDGDGDAFADNYLCASTRS